MWEFLTIVAACMLLLRFRRARYREYAAAKMLTSPLFRTSSVLKVLLIGVVVYMASLGRDVPWGWWIVLGAMVIAILAMRRALKWRYPYP
jgi:hypothetical protein